MEKKIKVMTIGDMPLSPSGVGIQSKNVIECLLKSGEYSVVSLGGAVKHPNYSPIKLEEYGDDWVIHPVDGFGNPDVVRSVIRNFKPDILWFMTDPRFYEWLWALENEIRPLMPMVYYHVWDNVPYPTFNQVYYESNDFVATISKLTDDIVANVAPSVDREYVPHAVNNEIFMPVPSEQIEALKKDNFSHWDENKFLFVWNNRNARRKMSSSVIWWFKEFLDKVGHDKACLLMHTDPHDSNGPNLEAIIHELKLTNGEVVFSRGKVPPNHLAVIYNMADCVINISDAEGFGLSTLEALACGTPIIVCMTGGLQEQVTDGKNWFGIGIEPASKAIIGSQQVPFIYEDRVSKDDFVNALLKIYNTPKKELREMGELGRQHVLKNYNFKNFKKQWLKIMKQVHEKNGSWVTRKNYNSWTFKEVK